MLASLSIRDVVLIDKLDLEFSCGLSVLTGETGAGKSILLDSLGLALGERGNSSLVRPGASKLSVTAVFDVPAAHPARTLLADQDISIIDDIIVVRRALGKDGRSRAFINDQAISVTLLRNITSTLVEIHGQFDTHGLMDPNTHITVLDRFRHVTSGSEVDKVCQAAWTAWKESRKNFKTAEKLLRETNAEEDQLRSDASTLERLAPVRGEESELTAKRALLRHGEQILSALETARRILVEPSDVDSALRTARSELDRVAPKAEGRLDAISEALERAAIEVSEAFSCFDEAVAAFDIDPAELEAAEERLFALKAQAQKHKVAVDLLADTLDKIMYRLETIERGEDNLMCLAKTEQAARATFIQAARALTQARHKAGDILVGAILDELPELHLHNSEFAIAINNLPENEWSATGCDRIVFETRTNEGMPLGPLNKIASGGELARFLLALKVVVSRSQLPAVMIFDEVDSGIGGATASAVGERLARLANTVQVLVVTHSPQVAARADSHWRVTKVNKGPLTATRVLHLTADARREEIARMLSGADITDEARGAADALMAGSSQNG
ncbi:MAG: DNA repair protein RecN [Rhodospirillaceae bacterium]